MSKQDLNYIIRSVTENNINEFIPKANIRNACVAAIIRWKSYILDNVNSDQPLAKSANDFLNQSWVNDCHGEVEILFIQRALRPGDFWSGHVAFPGGKNEASDKHNLDTVIRECKEEIGVDLGTPEFISLGTLKHRMITNMEGKVIMTLVPHVFLQVAPVTPAFTIQPSEVAEAYWIPVRYLLTDPIIPYDPRVDTMITPGEKLPWPTSVRVPAAPLTLPSGKVSHLWGMTLRMTQDILGMELSPHTVMSAEEVEKFKTTEAKRKHSKI